MSKILINLEEAVDAIDMLRSWSLVVTKVENALHRINPCRVDSAVGFPNTYLLDGDLSSGKR